MPVFFLQSGPSRLREEPLIATWSGLSLDRGYSFERGDRAAYALEAGMDQRGSPEGTRKSRIAVLQKEMEFIHYANELYWRKTNHGVAAKAEYYRRQDRLEEIRSELAERK